MANLVQSPAGSDPEFVGIVSRTMPLVGGISHPPPVARSGVERFGRLLTWRSLEPMRVIEMNMEQCRNEGVGETGDPRGNPPTNGIVRHDSHMRKSGVTWPRTERGSPCAKKQPSRPAASSRLMLRCVSSLEALHTEEPAEALPSLYCLSRTVMAGAVSPLTPQGTAPSRPPPACNN
ncbi:hypothetical protein PR048_016067 [Dryococelus australis]|uniref:Uncharacterized protein n=1 Tax=Dryococelus australis TaxID=614101 RepID=A0ABQ9HIV7_9NEOP|nr:hypothetical protein PR048_016067 [Dryococelus australis]